MDIEENENCKKEKPLKVFSLNLVMSNFYLVCVRVCVRVRVCKKNNTTKYKQHYQI